jgi:hypothetical protein
MRASGYDRAQDDWYLEPAWTVEAIASAEGLDSTVTCWDPACGGGNIPRVLRARGVECFASDIVDRGFGQQTDFFKWDGEGNTMAEVIISNPPYRIMEEWVRHALTLASDRVIILGRLALLEGQGRRAFWGATPLARVWVSSRRMAMPPGGTDVKATGGTIAYAWFVWQHGFNGKAELGHV